MYRLFYPIIRSWRTHAIDKTIAPHRLAISIFYDRVLASDAGAIANHLHRIIKPPSLIIEEKIYNNTFY